MSKSGKTSTIFLIVLSVFFVCTTGISVFFFLKEAEISKGLEMKVEELNATQAKLQADLQETQKQLQIAEGKKTEAEARIEDLMGELQIEQGAKDELKKQNQKLSGDLDTEKQSKEELRQQLSRDLEGAEQKVAELNKKLDLITKQKDEVESRRGELQKQFDDIKIKFDQMQADPAPAAEAPVIPVETPAAQTDAPAAGVQLGKIVVNPEPVAATPERGKIITIDADAEFLIVALGSKDGVKPDSILSVYEGEKYLGDVKATRVLEDMCAVDFVSPLNSRGVSKEDRVVLKK